MQMDKCKHTINYYVEKDAPVILWSDDGYYGVKYVTYRCIKCKKMIYKDHPWDKDWKEYKEKTVTKAAI